MRVGQVTVYVQGGSNSLLSSIEVSLTGDDRGQRQLASCEIRIFGNSSSCAVLLL